MNATELLVALAIAVGLVGILVPILPGSVLILGAVLVWAVTDGSGQAWVVFAVAAVMLVVGAVAKYTIPGRSLTATGVPQRTLLAGSALALVGFFVVPVVGLFLGFVVGVYLAERVRVGSDAWPSTRAALRAVGLSVLIELVTGVLAAVVWLTGVLAL